MLSWVIDFFGDTGRKPDLRVVCRDVWIQNVVMSNSFFGDTGRKPLPLYNPIYWRLHDWLVRENACEPVSQPHANVAGDKNFFIPTLPRTKLSHTTGNLLGQFCPKWDSFSRMFTGPAVENSWQRKISEPSPYLVLRTGSGNRIREISRRFFFWIAAICRILGKYGIWFPRGFPLSTFPCHAFVSTSSALHA